MKTILVIEDDKQYRKLLQEALQESGFTVLLAENGEEGYAVLEKQKIDLILLDLLMPKVDGTTFYYQLKNKLKKKTPIIVLTNLTDSAAYGSNIKNVLVKANVSLKEVVEVVKRTI
jgi:two-component system, OmpR family, response regulator